MAAADTDAEIEARGPRRDTVETVFTAAFRILIAEGAHALTPSRIHRETGVARTTIYRNWPDPSDLLAAMFERATGTQDMADFDGTLDHDLRVALDGLVFRFNERPVRALFGALVEHGRHGADTDIAADYITGILAPLTAAITDGIERGELRCSDPYDAALELAGPLLVRHVMLGLAVDDEQAAAAAAAFLDRYRV
ncbi:MAG: TetR/AcrR family transcriptional regulator [Actinomycetota bacterium]